MLTGAALSRVWPHDRAHYFFFFSRARWNPDDLGLAAAKLVISLRLSRYITGRSGARGYPRDGRAGRAGRRCPAGTRTVSAPGRTATVSVRPGVTTSPSTSRGSTA